MEWMDVKIINWTMTPVTHIIVSFDKNITIALKHISNLFLHCITLVRRIVLDSHATKGILVKRKCLENLILLSFHI